jgi:16S rRNA processing protein RimM
VWVVKKGGKEVLIPYIDDVVQSIDIDEKEIVITVMEGLLD